MDVQLSTRLGPVACRNEFRPNGIDTQVTQVHAYFAKYNLITGYIYIYIYMYIRYTVLRFFIILQYISKIGLRSLILFVTHFKAIYAFERYLQL